jgi:hypothetical protein
VRSQALNSYFFKLLTLAIALFVRNAGIVVIHQLPVKPETLWLRLLGRGKVQQQGIDELVSLPVGYPLKSVILEVLYTLQKNLEVNQQNRETEDRELMMRLAPLYQEDRAKAIQEGFDRGEVQGIAKGMAEGIAKGKKQGELDLILRLLTRKLGNLNPEITAKVTQLGLESLEKLGEALLDFKTQQDLETWLTNNSL